MQKLQNLKAAVIIAATILCVIAIVLYFIGSNYVFMCGGLHHRDLRGTGLTAEQYDAILEAQPNCRIQWDVPFQGQALAADTNTLTITHLTQEDVELLDHLPDLAQIDAQACKDYALLQQLHNRESGNALAAAGFAHDAQGLTGIQLQVDTVDRADSAVHGTELGTESTNF